MADSNQKNGPEDRQNWPPVEGLFRRPAHQDRETGNMGCFPVVVQHVQSEVKVFRDNNTLICDGNSQV